MRDVPHILQQQNACCNFDSPYTPLNFTHLDTNGEESIEEEDEENEEEDNTEENGSQEEGEDSNNR